MMIIIGIVLMFSGIGHFLDYGGEYRAYYEFYGCMDWSRGAVGALTYFFLGLLLVVIGIIRTTTKAKEVKRQEERQQDIRERTRMLREEISALRSIDYKQLVGNSENLTFQDVIKKHITSVFTIENERKYRTLPDGTSTGWEKTKERLEKLLTILDEHKEIDRYINVAFQHFVQERWDACSINLRKMIEWMILTKIDAEETLFAGEQLPTMIELIKMYYNENTFERYIGITTADNMIKIHKNGNKAAHTFVSNEDAVDLNTCCSDFQRMEFVILYYFEDEKVRHYLKTPLKDVKVYFELIDTLIIGEYYEDVAVNIRKTLELLVRSYFTKYQVRCLEGYQRDLCGYIDLLYFKNFISEESKSNMHKLRTITNEGAHMKTTKPHIDKENMLKCFEILKKEVEIYENI